MQRMGFSSDKVVNNILWFSNAVLIQSISDLCRSRMKHAVFHSHVYLPSMCAHVMHGPHVLSVCLSKCLVKRACDDSQSRRSLLI